MKKEDFKVGMKFKWNGSMFEILDTKYIDHLVIARHLDCDLVSGICSACYPDMVKVAPVPKEDGVLYVYQRKKDPRQVMAKYIASNGDVFIGIAKCNPEDDFVFQIGANLALQRCLEAKKDYEDWLSSPSMTLGDMWLKGQNSYQAYLDFVKKKGNK